MHSRRRIIWQAIEERAPAVAKLLLPRSYVSVGDYASIKDVAACLAAPYIYTRRDLWAHNPSIINDPAESGGLFCVHALMAHGMPAFFLRRDFLAAAIETRPPLDLPADQLRFPMPAMLFMLPRGFLKSPEDGEVDFIAIGRFEGSLSPIPKFSPHEDSVAMPVDGICYYCIASSGSSFGGYVPFPPTAKLGDALKGFAEEGVSSYRLEPDPASPRRRQVVAGPISSSDVEFTGQVLAIGLKITLAMIARPDLVTTAREVRPANPDPRRPQSALWQPNIIGENYAVPGRDKDSSDTHASPRLHWRRGHYRHQAFGANYTQHKIIWIEPVLVAAD